MKTPDEKNIAKQSGCLLIVPLLRLTLKKAYGAI